MFLWVPVHSEAVPETNTESWSEEWFQEASVREQEGKMCNTRDTFQNCVSEEGYVGTFNQQLRYPWGQGLSGGVGGGSGQGDSSDCRALSVHVAAGGALASQKEAFRIESRMTHSMSLWGHSAIGFSVRFNVGSSQTTLPVRLWPLPTADSSDTNGVTSIWEHRISSGCPQCREGWGSNGLGNTVAQCSFSSVFQYCLAKLSTFSSSKQNLSFFFFFPLLTVCPSPLEISLLFSLYSLYIPLPQNIVASYVSVLGSQPLIFLSSKPNAALLLSSFIFLQLVAEYLPVSQAGNSQRTTSFLIPQ